MKKIASISLLISLISGICHAKSGDFSCEVAKINDEDAVMYFEIGKGALISGNFKDKAIKVGSLEYEGKEEVKVQGKSPNYKVYFKDPESGTWVFAIDYTSGIGKLVDASGDTQVLANCAWQLGVDPFAQPDIALGN